MAAFYINPAEDIVPLTASANTFPATTGGLHIDTTGSFTFTTVGGREVTRTLSAGYHPLQIIKLTAGTGAAGLYAKAR